MAYQFHHNQSSHRTAIHWFMIYFQFQTNVQDEEVANLITINKTNFVVASVLARDLKRDIDFDFSLHQNFPTAKLV